MPLDGMDLSDPSRRDGIIETRGNVKRSFNCWFATVLDISGAYGP